MKRNYRTGGWLVTLAAAGGLAAFSAPAFAQQDNGLLSLDDLRRVLRQSEQPAPEEPAQTQQIAPTPEPEAVASAPEPIEENRPITIEDLRKALGETPSDPPPPAPEPEIAVSEPQIVETPQPEEPVAEPPVTTLLPQLPAIQDVEPPAAAAAPVRSLRPSPQRLRPQAETTSVDQASLEPTPAPTLATTPEPAAAPAAPPAPPEPVSAAPIYKSDLSKWVCRASPRFELGATSFSSPPPTQGKFRVYFGAGGYALTRSAAAVLVRNGADLRDLVARGDKIVVIGHADATGDSTANTILSLQRAYNIKACIIWLLGVPEPSIEVVGFGSFSPILEPEEPTPAGNRRADIMAYSEYRARFEDTFSNLNR